MVEELAEVVEIIVDPFVVEADHPRNSDLLIQSIPGARLRSAVKAHRTVTDQKTQEIMIPRDQAEGLVGFPETPGMRLHVNPAELTYMIEDPLEGDDELCERIKRFVSKKGIGVIGTIKGVPLQKGKLDVHRMKTLCRELLNLLNIHHVKPIKSPVPALADIERLPGNFLLNPGMRVSNQQPTYEKDWDQWLENLTRSGG